MRLKQTQGQQYAQNYGRTPAPGRVSQLLTRPLQQTMQPGVQFRPLPDNIPRAGQLPIPARAGPEVDASKLDVTDMMDVTSYTGLNMREEEDNMANSILTAPGSQYQIPGVSRIKDQSFLNLPALRKKVEAVAQGADVSEVDKDLLPYLALAAQERLRDLLQCMIQAAKHRTGALHERFLQNERELIAKGEDALDLQVITRQDPRKVLSALEKKERAQEAKLRAAKTAATQGQGEGADSMDVPGGAGGGDKEEGAKKKRKAIRDKDLPEHIRLERANAALATAIGGAPMKSWMLAGGSASAGGSTSGPLKVVPSRKRKADGELGTPMSGTKGPPGTAVHNSIRLPGGGLGRKKGGEPVARKVTLKDALFCLEGEHAMTKSLLVYKWWANVT
ncbi:transcription initiation factor TFIID component TAF4 family-domain-containing protein [Powellomyces hirtus]|nr:transcription initiation factor TFIID component TAF4 family-domain-containing protein [Powellomyces hirtus]